MAILKIEYIDDNGEIEFVSTEHKDKNGSLRKQFDDLVEYYKFGGIMIKRKWRK